MKNRLFTILSIAVFTLSLCLSVAAQSNGNSRPSPSQPRPNVPRWVKVMLPCSNGGGHQDVSKNLSITNTTGGTLAIDTLVYYLASDGDKDSLKIDNAVTTGGKFTLHGKAGQN